MTKKVIGVTAGKEALKKVGAPTKGKDAKIKRISVVFTKSEYADVLRFAKSTYTAPATWVRGVVATLIGWNKEDHNENR